MYDSVWVDWGGVGGVGVGSVFVGVNCVGAGWGSVWWVGRGWCYVVRILLSYVVDRVCRSVSCFAIVGGSGVFSSVLIRVGLSLVNARRCLVFSSVARLWIPP